MKPDFCNFDGFFIVVEEVWPPCTFFILNPKAGFLAGISSSVVTERFLREDESVGISQNFPHERPLELEIREINQKKALKY